MIKRGSFFFLKGIVLNWLENLSSQFHEVLINPQWCNQKFSKGGPAVLNLSPKDFYFASGKLLFIQSFFFKLNLMTEEASPAPSPFTEPYHVRVDYILSI